MKKDLTAYTGNELNMWVQNDEHLYNEYNKCLRCGDIGPLIETLDEVFIYSDAQMNELKNDFDQEFNSLISEAERQ